VNVALYPDLADGPDAMGLRTISICTGGGGLDLGFELAFPGARPICLVEREAFAAAPELEPALCRVVDGLAAGLDNARIDRLRMLGNGVVPLAAGYALRALWHAHAARGNVRADEFILRVEHYGV